MRVTFILVLSFLVSLPALAFDSKGFLLSDYDSEKGYLLERYGSASKQQGETGTEGGGTTHELYRLRSKIQRPDLMKKFELFETHRVVMAIATNALNLYRVLHRTNFDFGDPTINEEFTPEVFERTLKRIKVLAENDEDILFFVAPHLYENGAVTPSPSSGKEVSYLNNPTIGTLRVNHYMLYQVDRLLPYADQMGILVHEIMNLAFIDDPSPGYPKSKKVTDAFHRFLSGEINPHFMVDSAVSDVLEKSAQCRNFDYDGKKAVRKQLDDLQKVDHVMVDLMKGFLAIPVDRLDSPYKTAYEMAMDTILPMTLGITSRYSVKFADAYVRCL